MASLSLQDPIVQSFIVYSAILAVKLLLLAPTIGLLRVIRGVVITPEDAKLSRRFKVKYDDPVIERIRRAHLNDLENIPAFWVLGALYLTTGPVTAWTTFLFRTFAVARIIHTIVYAIIPMLQLRGIAFILSECVNGYMGLRVILYYIAAM